MISLCPVIVGEQGDARVDQVFEIVSVVEFRRVHLFEPLPVSSLFSLGAYCGSSSLAGLASVAVSSSAIGLRSNIYTSTGTSCSVLARTGAAVCIVLHADTAWCGASDPFSYRSLTSPG